jgi:hypothetical protein
MRNTEMLDLQPVYLAFFLLYLKASVVCILIFWRSICQRKSAC